MTTRVYQWGQLANQGYLVDPRYGVTYRKLDYWTRNHFLGNGVTERPGSGITRRWTWSEVQLALTIGALTELGFDLTTAVSLAPRVFASTNSPAMVTRTDLGLFVSIAFDAPKEPER